MKSKYAEQYEWARDVMRDIMSTINQLPAPDENVVIDASHVRKMSRMVGALTDCLINVKQAIASNYE